MLAVQVDPGRECLDQAYRYAEEVRDGLIPVCKLTRLCVERWFKDLETGPQRGLYFSEDQAARVFRFFAHCRHYQGKWAGTPITLAGWQCFIVAQLFGWIREDGTRRFRMAYEEIPRKNGKTTKLGGIGLYALSSDGEAGPKVYSAATKRDQARELFDSAKAMVMQSPSLKRIIRVLDRKSTRLNSSHVKISYAVFCLKK